MHTTSPLRDVSSPEGSRAFVFIIAVLLCKIALEKKGRHVEFTKNWSLTWWDVSRLRPYVMFVLLDFVYLSAFLFLLHIIILLASLPPARIFTKERSFGYMRQDTIAHLTLVVTKSI